MSSLFVKVPPEAVLQARQERRKFIHDPLGARWAVDQLDIRRPYVVRMDDQWKPKEVEKALIMDTMLQKLPRFIQRSDRVTQVLITELEECTVDEMRELVWDCCVLQKTKF